MNLSELYAQHVTKEQKDRDPLRLFVSDVGKCPRMTAYRLTQTKTDPVADQTIINKMIMFDLAEHIEAKLAEVLDEQGLLIAYQDDVEFGDKRENWGGRLDIVAKYEGHNRIIEVKTLHPNAFRYEFNYPAHQCQAAVYDLYCMDKYDLTGLPILAYFDRGGTNTPKETEVALPSDYIYRLMDELEEVRECVPELPPKREKVLKVRSAGKSIVQEPHGDCAYCDYSMTCQPDMSKSTWATRESTMHMWKVTKAADPEKLSEFSLTLLGKS